MGLLDRLRASLRLAPRCANCGRPIEGRPYEWRGKKFCSRACKDAYRRSHSRKRSERKSRVRWPRDAFGAVYWR